MKKSLYLLAGLLGLFCLSSCQVEPAESWVSINIENNTEEEFDVTLYDCWANFKYDVELDYKTVNICYSNAIVSKENKKDSVFFDYVYGPYALVDTLGLKTTYVLIVKDKSGNTVYKACGWPESWKTSAPEGWNVSTDDFNKYGIGYVSRADKNDIARYYYLDSDGKVSFSDGSLRYTLKINSKDDFQLILM